MGLPRGRARSVRAVDRLGSGTDMPTAAASPLALRWPVPVLAAIAAVALAVPAWVVSHPPHIPPPARRAVQTPVRVVPAAELPPVEPTRFQNLPPDEARAWNAEVPFVPGPNPAARPFRLTGAPEDQARAIDCMAAAMLYEAGDDPVGERAVGQVVINRARHPAYPKTICGVVFQGQERRTGCQFTFTCDGALARLPDPAKWARAQVLAQQALAGAVVAKVGYATHYHTDWWCRIGVPASTRSPRSTPTCSSAGPGGGAPLPPSAARSTSASRSSPN